MSANSSLFAKIRHALVSVGRSERTATRKARLLESASFADFVRLTPEQNVKLGLSRKARHYVLKDVKRVTKATPTISARQFETKKRARAVRPNARAGDGSASPRAQFATCPPTNASASPRRQSRARKRRSSRRSRSSARPASTFRATRPTRDAMGVRTRSLPDAERRYRAIRRRKLAGEHIPDGEWHWFIDYARRFKDPRYELLRGSPAAFGFSLAS